ncbi:neuromedin-U receptor 2-like [Patiria miniata]|uniref:G-protein coupled receptors family 1 profile domain-containing protein n=1 Tax=Patiria miniata TaxID=46514 RepID=A0A914AEX8_PATMI|nr:neuromedin-U receptor 2-like [Patiria miniata]
MGSEMPQCSVDGIHRNLTIYTAQEFFFGDLEVVLITIALPVIFTVGLLCNGAFMFVVARVPSMRTDTNIYLVNLAFSDILFLLALLINYLAKYLNYQVRTAHSAVPDCFLYNLTLYTTHFAGLALISVTSLERYIAVCHPLRRRVMGGRDRTVRLVVTCWISALIFAALMLPGFAKYQEYCVKWPEDITNHPKYQNLPTVVYICEPVDDWAYQMLYLTQTLPFTVVFLLNVYFYTRIVLRLHKRHVVKKRRSAIRTRNQVAVMLVANGTVFFLALSCFETVSLILFFEHTLGTFFIPDHVRPPLLAAGKILLYINAAINPLVYTVFNSHYRRAFVEAFKMSRRSIKLPKPIPLTGGLFHRSSETGSPDNQPAKQAIPSVSVSLQ